MGEVKSFEHEEFGSVRTILIDEEPWFVAKDVAVILKYSNPQKAIRDHVQIEDKTVNESFTVNGTMAILINESGLYSLILSSKMAKAKKFKRWVTSEILPSIRKHGMYTTPETLENLMNNPDFMIKTFQILKEEQERRKQLEAENAELSKKATYLDKILQSKTAIPITVISKDYGMSGVAMNCLLHSLKIQYKLKSGTWVLYQEYADCSYTKSVTYQYDEDKTSVQTLWTQKGRQFLYNILLENGYLPLCEQV